MQGFIPCYIDQQIAMANYDGRMQAIVLFADLQGFTGYTEQLLALGNTGAERLSRMLNSVFSAASVCIHTREGFIPYFAGDAFTGIFKGTNRIRQALEAANAIRYELDQLDIDIPLRIGIGIGDLEWHITKEQPYRWYIRGAGIESAVQAEQLAGPDEICVSRVIAEQATDLEYVPLSAKDYLVLATQSIPDHPVSMPYPTHQASSFYPEYLKDRFHTGEFRNVTSLFMSFPGDLEIKNLDELLLISCTEIERRGGYFKEVDLTDKGGLLVAFFGAPINMGDSFRAAIDVAFHIRNHYSPDNLAIRFGISSGPAFCGIVGDDYRRQYIVAGRSVNLAARLALKASKGEIRSDEITSSLPNLIRDDLGLIQAKGFKEPIPVFALHGFKKKERGNQSFYRSPELLHPYITQFRALKGMCLEITGDPGAGKSFTAQVFTQLSTQDFYWLKVDAHPMRTSPFEDLETAWKQVAAPPSASKLEASLVQLMQIRSNIEMPVKERFNQISSIHEDLLRHTGNGKSLAIWIEHWPDLDYASRDLFIYMANDQAINLLVTGRDIYQDLKVEQLQTLKLPPLTNQGVLRMAEFLLHQKPAPELVDSIQQAVNGNPFYGEQFIYYLRSKGLIQQDEKGYASIPNRDIQLGGSLRDILLARLDQLDVGVRELLPLAAILGKQFEKTLLHELLLAFAIIDEDLDNWLFQAESAEILHSEDKNLYLFRHGLLREVILEVQLESRRKHIHGVIVQVMENYYKGSLDKYFPELAQHCREAGFDTQAISYYRKAAKKAISQYQNREAIDFIGHALALAVQPKDRMDLILASIPAHVALGQWDVALHLLEDPMFNSKIAPLLDAQRLASKGHILVLSGKYKEASRVLNTSLDTFKELGNKEGLAECMRDLSVLHFRMGEYGLAESFMTQTFALLEGMELLKDSALVLNLSLIRMNQGRYIEAEQLIFNELMIRLQTGENQSLIALYVNLGVIQNEMGKFQEAFQNLQKGYQLAATFGNKLWLSIALGTRGLVQQNTGDWDGALKDFESDLILARELGDPQGQAIALELIGSLNIQKGIWNEGEQYLQQSLSICRSLGYKKGLIKSLLALGQSSLWQGEITVADGLFDEALSIANEIGNRKLIASTYLEKAMVGALEGKIEAAQKYLDQAEVDVVLWGEPILLGLWKRLRLQILPMEEKLRALHSARLNDSDAWTQAEAFFQTWKMEGHQQDRIKAVSLYQKCAEGMPHILIKNRLKQLLS